MDSDLQKYLKVNIEWWVEVGSLLFTNENVGHLSVLFDNCGGLKMSVNGWTPRFHLFFCTDDQPHTPRHHHQSLLKTSSSDVVSVLNRMSNFVFFVAGLVADVCTGEDAVEVSAISWSDDALAAELFRRPRLRWCMWRGGGGDTTELNLWGIKYPECLSENAPVHTQVEPAWILPNLSWVARYALQQTEHCRKRH